MSEEDAKAPRGTDGSMPTKFARLKSGSVLIDKGLWKNIPYTNEFPWLKQDVYGAARDLGPYELQEGPINTGLQLILTMDSKLSLSISPNPCNREAVVKFSTEISGNATLNICNLSGQIIRKAYQGQADSGADYYIPVPVNDLSNGAYLCQLVVGNQVKTSKLLVVR